MDGDSSWILWSLRFHTFSYWISDFLKFLFFFGLFQIFCRPEIDPNVKSPKPTCISQLCHLRSCQMHFFAFYTMSNAFFAFDTISNAFFPFEVMSNAFFAFEKNSNNNVVSNWTTCLVQRFMFCIKKTFCNQAEVNQAPGDNTNSRGESVLCECLVA